MQPDDIREVLDALAENKTFESVLREYGYVPIEEIATLKAAARELIDAVCYEPFPDRIEAAIAVLERIGV